MRLWEPLTARTDPTLVFRVGYRVYLDQRGRPGGAGGRLAMTHYNDVALLLPGTLAAVAANRKKLPL